MKRKHLLTVFAIAALSFVSVPVFHLLKTKWMEDDLRLINPDGYANDVSQLNLTRVDTIVAVEKDKASIESQLRRILKHAEENGIKVSVAGARHSMGGHTMYQDGIVLDILPYSHMHFDSLQNTVTVGSGALWEDIIPYLDKFGKSVAVMQAFSSFSVGGSISVNGHGWQKDAPPISSSLLSFSLMNYKGEVMQCSRSENEELFRLATGGYGLFGIILDVTLRVTDNVALRRRSIPIHPYNYVEFYKKHVSGNPNVQLAFGRLRISEKEFLDEATLNYFERTDAAPLPLQEQNKKNEEIKRLVFRGSVGSEYGKRLRWDLERGTNKMSENAIYSRNELLNDHASLIENKDAASTDLLQEYFIPESNFAHFIDDIKPILQKSAVDLLNITIRGVQKDEDSFLNYAREDVFGFVLLFNQKKTDDQEVAMKKLTNELAAAALKNGGTYYLPYRLHIDRNKMRKSYPQANAFFQLKKKHDPKEIFNNKFYEHYK